MQVRARGAEILDGPVTSQALLAGSFREVWGVNRYLGGMAVLRRHLRPLVQGPASTLVDVAGGTGDVAMALIRWAAGRGTDLQVTLVDHHPQVLAIARTRAAAAPGLSVVAGDGRRLPFADRSFDVALCNLALHHFDEADAVLLLQELDRVSRRGWVVADLERHPLAYGAARLLARTLWRNPITRHDGPLSVRRAYRAAEAAELVRAAGVRAGVYRHLPWLLAVVSRR
jgi:ubiquinone/menaquinone biosynthesis C-methylase UbiE